MSNPAFADAQAVNYFALRGMNAQRLDSRVVVDGCVYVKVLYSTARRYNDYFHWKLPRPIVCDVLMLIADLIDPELRTTRGVARAFYLFNPDDDVFYYADERQKRFVTWYPERIEQRHHEQRYEALTTPVMAEARDRLELIEAARMEKARG